MSTKSYKDFDVQLVLSELSLFSDYDRDLGAFIRTQFRNGKTEGQVIGKPVGAIGPKGHLWLKLFDYLFFIHNLVWATEYGDWPRSELDHKDMNPQNNHIDNLRAVGPALNNKNRRQFRNNSTGFTGVVFNRQTNKFMARVTHNYKQIYLGLHATAEEAYIARQKFIMAHPEMGFTKQHGV